MTWLKKSCLILGYYLRTQDLVGTGELRTERRTQVADSTDMSLVRTREILDRHSPGSEMSGSLDRCVRALVDEDPVS